MKQRSKLNFSSLMLTETDNVLLQFFRYCFVGGIATVVDWFCLYMTEKIGLHYLLAAVIGFLAGLICNYILSKLIVFKGKKAKVGYKKEFLAYGLIGVMGLILTLLLMYIMTEWLEFYFMISKVIVTILVLFWNFFMRKYMLY